MKKKDTNEKNTNELSIQPQSNEGQFGSRLEHDPRFLERIMAARKSLRAGKGIPWEALASTDGDNKQH